MHIRLILPKGYNILTFGLEHLLQNLVFNMEDRRMKKKSTPKLFKCIISVKMCKQILCLYSLFSNELIFFHV